MVYFMNIQCLLRPGSLNRQTSTAWGGVFQDLQLPSLHGRCREVALTLLEELGEVKSRLGGILLVDDVNVTGLQNM